MERYYYLDAYNGCKVWEVTKLSGGYYLRQYIWGKQFGRGFKTTGRRIEEIGIFGFQPIPFLHREGKILVS